MAEGSTGGFATLAPPICYIRRLRLLRLRFKINLSGLARLESVPAMGIGCRRLQADNRLSPAIDRLLVFREPATFSRARAKKMLGARWGALYN